MRHQPTVFEQIVQQLPWSRFGELTRKCGLDRYDDFTPRKHFLALLGGILAGQQGLRSTTTALTPNNGALRLLGGKAPAPPTLSEANRNRPADLFIELFNELTAQTSRQLRRSLKAPLRLIDATHLDLGKRMQHWLGLHQGKVAAKLHVVFDPSRPSLGMTHDTNESGLRTPGIIPFASSWLRGESACLSTPPRTTPGEPP